jgi:phosphoglycerate kinase
MLFSSSRLFNKYISSLNNNITLSRNYKKTIDQLAKEYPSLLKNSKVLVRVDFNVPFKNNDGKIISDDTRIREALPTIKYLSNAGAKVILASHCSRPKGIINERMRMDPMAKRLSELLNQPVSTVNDCM